MLSRKNKIRFANRRVAVVSEVPIQWQLRKHTICHSKKKTRVDATGWMPMSRLEGSALGFREST